MECPFPTTHNDDEQVKQILQDAKVIAIVGLSPKEDKDSNKVARYLQNAGYKIIPIYPKEEAILGEKVYRDLSEIQEKIDIVDVFRKPAIVMDIAQKIIKRDDCKILWTQLGIVNNDAAKIAQDAGKIVVQNRCTKIEHARFFS